MLDCDDACVVEAFGVRHSNGDFDTLRVLIAHQLMGRLEVAAAFCQCFAFSASLPVVLMEQGAPDAGSVAARRTKALNQQGGPLFAPDDPVPAAGDTTGVHAPRFGIMTHIYGRPGAGRLAVSFGTDVWLPLRRFAGAASMNGSSDQYVSVRPKLVVTGRETSRRLRWSLTGAFLVRKSATPKDSRLPSAHVGAELQLGAALAYTDPLGRFHVGPEALLATTVAPRDRASVTNDTSIEVLLGAHVNLKHGRHRVQLGLAGGLSAMHHPGVPDARAVFRMAYERAPAAKAHSPWPPP